MLLSINAEFPCLFSLFLILFSFHCNNFHIHIYFFPFFLYNFSFSVYIRLLFRITLAKIVSRVSFSIFSTGIFPSSYSDQNNTTLVSFSLPKVRFDFLGFFFPSKSKLFRVRLHFLVPLLFLQLVGLSPFFQLFHFFFIPQERFETESVIFQCIPRETLRFCTHTLPKFPIL